MTSNVSFPEQTVYDTRQLDTSIQDKTPNRRSHRQAPEMLEDIEFGEIDFQGGTSKNDDHPQIGDSQPGANMYAARQNNHRKYKSTAGNTRRRKPRF